MRDRQQNPLSKEILLYCTYKYTIGLTKDNDMRVIIVDKNDKLLEYKERSDQSPKDIVRISEIFLINKDNEVLVAQRTKNKSQDSGKWGPSASRTVGEGENYKINIIKELEENLGFSIDPKELILAPKRFVETSPKDFVQMYFYKTNIKIKDFNIEKGEFAQIKWVDIPKLDKWLEKKPKDFTTSFGESFQDLKDLEND